MQIILEDVDLKAIDRLNEALAEDDEDFPLYITNKGRYSLQIEVTDIAKANNFIHRIVLSTKKEYREEIENLWGIKFKALDYSASAALTRIKDKLKSFLKEIEELEKY